MPTEEGTGSHRTADSCEPSSGCLDSNSGTLEKEPVFSIAELSLQPKKVLITRFSLPLKNVKGSLCWTTSKAWAEPQRLTNLGSVK